MKEKKIREVIAHLQINRLIKLIRAVNSLKQIKRCISNNYDILVVKQNESHKPVRSDYQDNKMHADFARILT